MQDAFQYLSASRGRPSCPVTLRTTRPLPPPLPSLLFRSLFPSSYRHGDEVAQKEKGGSSEYLRDRKTHKLYMRNAERATTSSAADEPRHVLNIFRPPLRSSLYTSLARREHVPPWSPTLQPWQFCQTHERSFYFPASRRPPPLRVCVSYITSVTPPLDPPRSV